MTFDERLALIVEAEALARGGGALRAELRPGLRGGVRESRGDALRREGSSLVGRRDSAQRRMTTTAGAILWTLPMTSPAPAVTFALERFGDRVRDIVLFGSHAACSVE